MLLELLIRFLQKTWEEDLCYCLRWVFTSTLLFHNLSLHSDIVFKQFHGTVSRYVVVASTRLRCHMWVDYVVGSLLIPRVFLWVPRLPPSPPLHFLFFTLLLKTSISKFEVDLVEEGGRIGTLGYSFREVGRAARRGQSVKR